MSTPSNDLNIQTAGYVVFDGVSQFSGRTFQAGTGITLTNASGVAGNTTIASTASLTDLHTARFIVASSTLGTGANFTSIASAIAAAQSTGVNSTVFIQPGTYTENLTLVPGVNLCAYECDAFTPNVTIAGTCTLTAAGTVSISGIRLQTNSAALLAVTGSAASIVNLRDCYLNCTNNTGITYSSSSASSRINIDNCKGNLGTTGIGLFANSSNAGSAMTINNSFFDNGGASTTASTVSSGTLSITSSTITFPITSSSTSITNFRNTIFDTSPQNATPSTMNGGTCVAYFCSFAGGSASAVSVGSTAALLEHCDISSTNTNAVTGSGTLTYSSLTFSNTSTTINTTTQTIAGTLQGSKNTAPTAGFLGERISSAVTSVSVSTSTPKSITNISITAGVWDISIIASGSYSAFVGTAFIIGISTTDNTFQGNTGDQQYSFNSTGAGVAVNLSGSVPAFRVVLSSTTTYYLICQTNFASGTGTVNGRITAVRVG